MAPQTALILFASWLIGAVALATLPRGAVLDLLTDENIAATAVSDLCAVFDDEIEERHRRHMLLRRLDGSQPQGRLQ